MTAQPESKTVADWELLAVRLVLQPRHAGALLPGSGRAVQAWWLGSLVAADPSLAERLHAGAERRPYSCSAVVGVPAGRPGEPAPVLPGRDYHIRIAAWEPTVVEHLARLIVAPPNEVVLGGVPFSVAGAGPDPAVAPATYADLATRYLLPAHEPGRPADVALRFLSATSFRQSATPRGRPAPVPFPLPALVWGGLLDRWQAVSPVQLEPGLRETLAWSIAVGRFAGESERVLVPGIGDPDRRTGATGGRWVVGFVGRCSYWWPRRDPYLGGVLRLLAAFAEFAGTGQGTAYGLGQVRWENKPRGQGAGGRAPGSARAERAEHPAEG